MAGRPRGSPRCSGQRRSRPGAGSGPRDGGSRWRHRCLRLGSPRRLRGCPGRSGRCPCLPGEGARFSSLGLHPPDAENPLRDPAGAARLCAAGPHRGRRPASLLRRLARRRAPRPAPVPRLLPSDLGGDARRHGGDGPGGGVPARRRTAAPAARDPGEHGSRPLRPPRSGGVLRRGAPLCPLGAVELHRLLSVPGGGAAVSRDRPGHADVPGDPDPARPHLGRDGGRGAP